MGVEEPQFFNMTIPELRTDLIANAGADLNMMDHLIIGSPVYSGKLPSQVIDCIKAIGGKRTKCSAVVVYGNRDYGIALHNMVDLLSQNGFEVVGAGAFIGQHSYSDLVPVAMGRPDKSDIELAQAFGKKCAGTLNRLDLNKIPVQMDRFAKSEKYSAIKPSYLEKRCLQCGKCTKACPLGLILFETGIVMTQKSEKQCIGCMACVQHCKPKARTLKTNPFVKVIMKGILKEALQNRKEPLMIFG